MHTTRMTTAFAMVAAAAAMAGCSGNLVSQTDAQRFSDDVKTEDMQYIRDTRTDLCYGVYMDETTSSDLSYRQSLSLASVSCTAEVAKEVATPVKDAYISASKLAYKQDGRTKTCFAYAVYNTLSTDLSVRTVAAVTGVPCKTAVLALAKK